MAQAAVPGFMFLVCPDSQFLHHHLEKLLAGTQAERHIYWGDEEPPARFWEDLTLQGLFGKPRVVVARQAQLWPAAIWKKISAALGHPSDQCRPFFCLEVGWDKGKPKIPAHLAKLRCFAFAEKQGWLWKNEGLNERSLRSYVKDRAATLGIAFEPDAFEQFCNTIVASACAIDNELQKLQLLLADHVARGNQARVVPAMLGSSAWSPESNIFACIRAIETGNLPAAWKELARSRNDVESMFFPLLSLLARNFRLLWQSCMGEAVRFHSSELREKQQLAARLGPQGIATALALLVDAEGDVKSGKRTVEQSLENLVSSLTTLCRPAT